MYSTMYLDFIMSFPPAQRDIASFGFFFFNLFLLCICLGIYAIKSLKDD